MKPIKRWMALVLAACVFGATLWTVCDESQTTQTTPMTEAVDSPDVDRKPWYPDSDGDGLSDDEESALGTKLYNGDSDGDGLSDGEEYNGSSDPLVRDTDADGVRDGYEIQLGTDPSVSQDSFTVTASYRQAVNVNVTLGGEAVETLRVEPTVYDRLFTSGIAGALSGAYDVSVAGEIKSGTLSIPFDTICAKPTVYYFSQATQSLEPLVTTIQNGTATATISQAGTYILLDRKVYEASFAWEDRWGSSIVYAGLEVVLVVDDSASMQNTDPYAERLTVIGDLIDRLPAESQIGIVRFATDVTTLMPLSQDRDALKDCLTTDVFTSNGQTYMYTGIQQALTLFSNDHAATQRVMIVLSDGQPTDRKLLDETIAMVAAAHVETYTVAFGSEHEIAHQVMIDYAAALGGTHFVAEDAEELSVVYRALADSFDIATDTDGDGIPDYYEDHLVSFVGMPITLDKTKADTDGDGIPDGDEVKVELVYSEDGTHVYVKGFLLSDPSFEDTDGDGIPDAEDDLPYDNSYTVTMDTAFSTSSMVVEMDYTWFFEDNTVYNPLLSETSAMFSTAAYGYGMRICDANREESTAISRMTDLLTYFKMENPQSYSLRKDFSDNHLSEVIVGYRTIRSGGELRTVLAVAVRGTDVSIEEWASNFDIGDLSKDTDEDDWVRTENHKGFDVAATRIAAFVERYIEENGLRRDQLIYWVTGHSRGAGIANILGAELEKAGKTAFTYTFASPNTTLSKDAASYKTIFNVINEDDFVPVLPSQAWGYTRYGRSTSGVSVSGSYKTYWENFTGIWGYNSSSKLEKCATAIANILDQGADPRIDCYRLTCRCHGDGSNPTITITNSGVTQSSRDKAIAKIPANALPGCVITTYEGGIIGGWDFDVCQTPYYFMQVLAAFMSGEIDAYRFAVELSVGERYKDAKSTLVEIGLGGVEHPHYPETYCMLAGVLTADAFGS